MLRAALVLLLWVVLGLPIALVVVPWMLVFRKPALLYRWGVWVGKTGLAAAGVHARVHFVSPLPANTPCLFLVNHASNLDPPVLASVLPRRTAMLVKRELLRIPLLGYAMRATGFVPVARSGSVEDARKSLVEATAVLRSGTSLVIFAEGTRSPDGKLLPLKKGPFFLAMESDVTVVPVTLRGTHALLPKGSLRLRAGTVEVTVHAPLQPREFADRDALREAVRERIASALGSAEANA